MRKFSLQKQFFISIISIVTLSITLYFTVDYLHYRTVALLLLLVVSVSAMLFDIYPVLVTAFLSAFIWNFFFIPPTFTLHIGSPEDALMFLMYFVIALINAVLSYKIREYQNLERDKIEREKTLKLYNSLLNSLSHEMRTPIATIIGSADILNENAQNISDENKIELLKEIETAGLRLDRQVGNLLNMSRLESGSIQLKKDWCDILELIQSAVKHNLKHKKNHQLKIEVKQDLPFVKMDRFLMEQVLINLIHNALIYTYDDSIIEIKASLAQSKLFIEVNDNGPGIPDDAKTQVFNKFFRLPQSKVGGTGLGLSIVKGFIEAHNGSIEIGKKIDKGLKINIIIPVETSNEIIK